MLLERPARFQQRPKNLRIFFLVNVGPSLGFSLRERKEENKGALSPPFSSFFHLELRGESKGELESADL
jgi:hypothetical protein